MHLSCCVLDIITKGFFEKRLISQSLVDIDAYFGNGVLFQESLTSKAVKIPLPVIAKTVCIVQSYVMSISHLHMQETNFIFVNMILARMFLMHFYSIYLLLVTSQVFILFQQFWL